MRPEVKRWFKIVFCTLMVVFCVSIGFSDWVYPDNSGDQTSETKKPEIIKLKPTNKKDMEYNLNTETVDANN